MITYNHEKYIREAIEGVLMQECDFEVELIVANDCSPDETNKIVNDIIKTHPRGHWIKYTEHTENKGMMPNFIWALEQCKSTYIALCEGDDYWTNPLKLQKQVDFLEENKQCSFCFHKAFIKDESASFNKNLLSYPIGLSKTILNTSEYLNIVTTATCSLVFRNIILEVFNVLEHSQGDFILYCELLHYGKAGFIDEIMSVYRKHEKGISFNNFSEGYLLNRIIELKREQKSFKNQIVKKEIGRIYKIHIKRYLRLYKTTFLNRKIIYLYIELLFNKSNRIEFYQKNLRKVKVKFKKGFNLTNFFR